MGLESGFETIVGKAEKPLDKRKLSTVEYQQFLEAAGLRDAVRTDAQVRAVFLEKIGVKHDPNYVFGSSAGNVDSELN